MDGPKNGAVGAKCKLSPHHRQQILERITELFTKLSAVTLHHEEGSSTTSPRQIRWGITAQWQPSLLCSQISELGFPCFNRGEDPTSWNFCVEQFFQYHETPVEDHVSLAYFHLKGDAQLWYQLFKQETTNVSWSDFKGQTFVLIQAYSILWLLWKAYQTSTNRDG